MSARNSHRGVSLTLDQVAEQDAARVATRAVLKSTRRSRRAGQDADRISRQARIARRAVQGNGV